ncbi:hypothetical protein [Thermoflexibacter ruber]|uniref:hypothetical protein n=1 Tax=Thermoflexibacter ruber TaxID=1003 RepID=UPI001160C72C|nr:hypothetical protein [Thermoflexibacter ruber]
MVYFTPTALLYVGLALSYKDDSPTGLNLHVVFSHWLTPQKVSENPKFHFFATFCNAISPKSVIDKNLN